MKCGKRSFAFLLASALALPATVMPAMVAPARANGLTAVARPESLGFLAERLSRMTAVFQGYIDKGEFPGAVIVVARKGQIAYARAFGKQDAETPMTLDSIFRIASMTKPIVSVAAMILVEEGRLSLAAPVAHYLPELKDVKVGVEKVDPAIGKAELILVPPRRPMIVQDLLRHTAGLVYAPPLGSGTISDMYKEAVVSTRDEPLAAMITKLGKLPLAHHPGEAWEYSVATDVLGRVVEVVSGMALDRFVAERITGPLGMAATGFVVAPADHGRIAQPKPPADGATPLFDPTRMPVRLSGGGGMVSTAGDYLRFCEMLLNGGALGGTRLLAPSTVALMTADALRPGSLYSASAQRSVDSAPTPALGQGFGLGFSVRTAAGHNPLPGSVGSYFWSGAYGTTFYIDPAEKLILILMTQMPLGSSAPYRHAVRYLTYQAMVPAD